MKEIDEILKLIGYLKDFPNLAQKLENFLKLEHLTNEDCKRLNKIAYAIGTFTCFWSQISSLLDNLLDQKYKEFHNEE